MKSRAKFGKKLKGFIAKKVATYYDDEDDDSRLLFADEPSVQVPVTVISQCDWEPTAVEISEPVVTAPRKTTQTNADRVLNKLIKELKIDELDVPEMESDEVSEFDGKSAQVLAGDTSEESEEEVVRRLDAVVAAAEEIRKKKNAEKSASRSVRRKREMEIEAPDEGSDEEEDDDSSIDSEQDEELEKVHSSNKSMKSKRSSAKSIKSKRSSAKSIKSKRSSAKSIKSKKSSKSLHKSQSLKKILDTSDDELKTEDIRSQSTLETSDDTFDMNNGSHEDGDNAGMNNSEEDDVRTLRSMRSVRSGKGRTIMNKDVIIHVPGGPENLVVRKMYYTPVPKEPEEVIIEVEASTVTVRDCLLSRGVGVDKAEFPFTPGCELVGTITDVGKIAQHEGWSIGDRVVAFDHSKGGGNAKCVKVHMKNISMISTTIDAASAACLVDVYMTAYKALQLGRRDSLPLTGKKILVTDGFSPLGQAVVALAKLEGANIYVTTSDSNEHEYMSSLGVKCFPFSPSKWLHKVAGLMDIVIDNTCLDSYESSWEAVSTEGMLVCTTGMNSTYNFRLDEFEDGCAGGCADAFGVNVLKYRSKWAAMKAKYLMSNTTFLDLTESLTADPKAYQQQLKYLCFLVESGALVPKIAERIQIEEVPDAHRYLETGKSNGTIVCVPSDKS